MSDWIHTSITFEGNEADFARAVVLRDLRAEDKSCITDPEFGRTPDGRLVARFDSQCTYEVCIAQALSALLPSREVHIDWVLPARYRVGFAAFQAGQLLRFDRRDGDEITRFDGVGARYQVFRIEYADPDEAPFTDDYTEVCVLDDFDASVQLSCSQYQEGADTR